MSRRLGVWTLAGACWLATSLAPASARADGAPKLRDSLWMPLGVNLGYSFNPAPASNGLLIGPELSLVYLDASAYWLGAYTDALRDFGADATRLSAGLEGGVAVFGLDVGYVSAFSDGARTDGLRGRVIVSFVIAQLYGGVGHSFTAPDSRTYGEAGLLLKIPIQLWEDPTPRWRPDTPAARPWSPEPTAPATEPARPSEPTRFVEPPPE